jgi:hypothetical protein
MTEKAAEEEKTGKTVQVTIRMEAELLKAITVMAEKEIRSTSSMIRLLLHRVVTK